MTGFIPLIIRCPFINYLALLPELWGISANILLFNLLINISDAHEVF